MIRILLFLAAILLSCAQLDAAVTKSFREVTAKADADLQAGNVDAAIEEYNRVIVLKLTPQLASIAVMRRGNCYYAKHDLEQAIADYDQALRLDPKNAGAYDNRANALDARGNRDDALKDYDEALRLSPRNAYVYLNRGSLLMELGDFSGALADYARVLTINPREEAAHIGRSRIYLMECKREEALKEAGAAIAIAPGRALGYDCRASVYMELRRYKEAEADIKKAMGLTYYDPTAALSSLAWFRATCPDPHFRNGKEALEAARRRCQNTNFFGYACLDTLAAAYAETGDFDQAAKSEAQAIRTAPSRLPGLPEMKERLNLYKSQKPFRDEPRKTPIQSKSKVK
jgi:tetratricopeptide (TPR) repeat protein